MQVIQAIAEATSLVEAYKTQRAQVALVPTMGNLHQGHLSLVELAQQQADKVVVSIFVNPMQFGPNEDFDTYPRTLQADLDKLQAANVDLVFCPQMSDIYPQGAAASTKVEVPVIGEHLEASFRPGFFIGVASVVCKLFHMLPAQYAVFGKKDYQQLQVIRQMVADLNFAIEIIAADTVREADGLAMSSRNAYLSAKERTVAPTLYQTLHTAREKLLQGEAVQAVQAQAKQQLIAHGFVPDYVTVANRDGLQPAKNIEHAVILAAATLGKTRLIDNLEI